MNHFNLLIHRKINQKYLNENKFQMNDTPKQVHNTNDKVSKISDYLFRDDWKKVFSNHEGHSTIEVYVNYGLSQVDFVIYDDDGNSSTKNLGLVQGLTLIESLQALTNEPEPEPEPDVWLFPPPDDFEPPTPPTPSPPGGGASIRYAKAA